MREDWDWERAARKERMRGEEREPSGESRTTGGMVFRMGKNPAGPKMGAAIALILIGTAFFLNNLGVLQVGSLWLYWPVIVILTGVRQIYSASSESAYVRGFLAIGAGVLFQLQNLHILNISIAVLWPVALIGVGIMLLFRPGFGHGAGTVPGSIRNEVQEFSFFGGVKRVVTSREFRGGELLSIFGGIELDLRGAEIAPGVTEVQVEANCAFGGIVIKVPDRWHVEVRGMGIFGGYEDKTLPVQAGLLPTAPALIIRGFAAFGGVTVE